MMLCDLGKCATVYNYIVPTSHECDGRNVHSIPVSCTCKVVRRNLVCIGFLHVVYSTQTVLMCTVYLILIVLCPEQFEKATHTRRHDTQFTILLTYTLLTVVNSA